MIEITYDGRQFDLYPNTKIPVEINSPLFDDDVVSGSFTFPFKMPLSPTNRRLLLLPDIIDNILPFLRKLENVHLNCDGIPLFVGDLIIRSVNAEVDAYILVGNSQVNAFASATKLADRVDFHKSFNGPDDVLSHMSATTLGSVETFPYVFFPVGSVSFYGKELPHLRYGLTAIQNFFKFDKFLVQEDGEETSKEVGYDWQAVTPFPYITYLLREAFKDYHFGHNIWETDEELKRLVLYNNFGLAHFVKEYRGSKEIWVNKNDRSINLKEHIPDMTISDLVIGLKNIFCLYFYAALDGKLHFGSIKELLARPVIINWTQKALPGNEISNDFSLGLRYAPDYKSDAAAESRVQSIKGKRILPYDILGPDAPPNCLYFLDGWGYFERPLILLDKYSSQFTDYYYQEAEFEVKSRITPLITDNINVLYDPFDILAFRGQVAPVIGQRGKFYDREGKFNDYAVAPRITFYRGYQLNSENTPYPMGSSDVFTYQQTKIPDANYSLAWEGTYGLRRQWWDSYLNMRRFGRKVIKQVRLQVNDLANLDLLSKVRIENANFLIKKINLELPLTLPAKVELWKTD